jgi:predicted transcriptional regulator
MVIPQKKTARQHIRLEPRQEVALQALAKRYDSTVSAVIRAAIDQFLSSSRRRNERIFQSAGSWRQRGRHGRRAPSRNRSRATPTVPRWQRTWRTSDA